MAGSVQRAEPRKSRLLDEEIFELCATGGPNQPLKDVLKTIIVCWSRSDALCVPPTVHLRDDGTGTTPMGKARPWPAPTTKESGRCVIRLGRATRGEPTEVYGARRRTIIVSVVK